MTSLSNDASLDALVWADKPWIVPSAIIHTLTVVVVSLLFLFLEMYFGVALNMLSVLSIYLWTLAAFTLVWAVSLLDLLVFWASHSYVLRESGLEVRSGIIQLHSFVVTPSGFGDLLLFQGLGGKIFGYGSLTVNSQGGRQTQLLLVRSPFRVARLIRDIMR